ncbi:MAG: transcriptional regulator [Cyanobacteria bacterium P01_A01_bin.116]
MTAIAPDIQKQWSAIAPILTIRTDKEYEQGIARLNELLDEVGTNETHPLYTLLDTLGIVIQSYEEAHYPIPNCDGIAVLAYLMEEHSLSPSDLSEIEEPATITAILEGKQALEIRHIRDLANRFGVSPSVFI